MQLQTFTKEIDYTDASEIFGGIKKYYTKKFLLESLDISHIYGRLSLIGIDPAFEIKGKDRTFLAHVLNERGGEYLKVFKKEEKNIVDPIKRFLKEFKSERKVFAGLYGAFSYDFVRQFENIPTIIKDPEQVPDYNLNFYDTFIFFDHLKQKAEILVYRKNEKEAQKAFGDILKNLKNRKERVENFSVKNAEFELKKEEYKNLVRRAQGLAKAGELFEIVFSNTLRANFSGDPYALYLKYREINPSPYMFYFDFGDEQLVGASPEMMVRCENGMVNTRPISGTMPRGRDPIEDHENMLKLLNSPKERAELDMLIDLGRNDLARVCEPGIRISDYRFVEKYSKVMHTVAHLSGKLRKDLSAFDALAACLNAGTLTGAPKVAAMTEIEKYEKSRRGYYGGAIGYLSLNGDMDTGIIIRTAHIKGKKLSFRVGATLLYDSDPDKEYEETMNKAGAFLTTFADEKN